MINYNNFSDCEKFKKRISKRPWQKVDGFVPSILIESLFFQVAATQ